MAQREFTEKELMTLSKKGHALEDGTYPCPDCDCVKRHLRKYRQGKVAASHKAKLSRLLHKRNEELGCGLDLGALEEF